MSDGGPAFPAELSNSGPQCGMMLRDYFAAQAMVHLMNAIDGDSIAHLRTQMDKAGVDGAYQLVALRAYEMADCMIAQKERFNG